MKKVLKFSAKWCGPCKMLATALKDVTFDVPVEEVDVDVDHKTTQDYNVRGVPTLILVEDGVEVKRIVGFKPVAQIREEFGI